MFFDALTSTLREQSFCAFTEMQSSSESSDSIEILSMAFAGTATSFEVDEPEEEEDPPTFNDSTETKPTANNRSAPPVHHQNTRVLDGTFRWSLLDGLEGTITRTYKADEVLVLANSVNTSLFRLVEGTVRIERSSGVLAGDLRNSSKTQLQEGKLSFGTVSSTSPWPVVCEMSALSESDKLTSMSILSNGESKVQIISRKALFSFLFSDSKMDDVACLFFETMCRYYTQKLRGLPMRKVEGRMDELYSGCLTINGEVVIFSSKVREREGDSHPAYSPIHMHTHTLTHSLTRSPTQVQAKSRLGKPDRMLSFSSSYVALLKAKEKGGYEVSFDANEREGIDPEA